MYKDIGKKISGWAKFVCILGIVVSVISGLALIAISAATGAGSGVFMGVLVIVIGALASWLSSLTMYGFGTLITKTEESNAALQELAKK